MMHKSSSYIYTYIDTYMYSFINSIMHIYIYAYMHNYAYTYVLFHTCMRIEEAHIEQALSRCTPWRVGAVDAAT